MAFFSRSMCYKVDQVWKNTFSNSCHFWLWSGFSNENITCDTREKYYCVFREKYFLVNCCLRRQEFFVTFSVTFFFKKTCVYYSIFHPPYIAKTIFFLVLHMWPQYIKFCKYFSMNLVNVQSIFLYREFLSKFENIWPAIFTFSNSFEQHPLKCKMFGRSINWRDDCGRWPFFTRKKWLFGNLNLVKSWSWF